MPLQQMLVQFPPGPVEHASARAALVKTPAKNAPPTIAPTDLSAFRRGIGLARVRDSSSNQEATNIFLLAQRNTNYRLT